MSRLGLLPRLFGAVVLGVATILLPKTRPDEHWSVTPRVKIVSETERAGPLQPADDD